MPFVFDFCIKHESLKKLKPHAVAIIICKIQAKSFLPTPVLPPMAMRCFGFSGVKTNMTVST